MVVQEQIRRALRGLVRARLIERDPDLHRAQG
jgi:hypothetical protein